MSFVNLPYKQLYQIASGQIVHFQQPQNQIGILGGIPQSPYGSIQIALSSGLQVVSKYVFNHTYTQPCSTSATATCNVQQGSILVVIAISADNQWLQLHGSNTWIPRSWVQ